MKLTDAACRNAKGKGKVYRLGDGGNLFLEVRPNGSKLWVFRYTRLGKSKSLGVGQYPSTPLQRAREKARQARSLLSDGLDPIEARHTEEAACQQVAIESALTLEKVAREWFDKHKPNWSPGHADTILARLEKHVFPYLGAQPVKHIAAPDLLTLLKRIEARGALETVHRVRGVLSQIFRYGVANCYCERDPAADLREAFPPARARPMAAVTLPREVAGLLRGIDGFEGTLVVRSALQLAPLVFVRPGELRHAEWEEIDLTAAQWRIPAHKMKLRREHLVPLSHQAVAVLEELFPLTGRGRYVFPSARTKSGGAYERPMSENSVLAALRRMGFGKDEMTGHGFRAMASTLLNEQGFNRDVIEKQLAHEEANSVRKAYNRAAYLDERVRMMQAWADYLDALRSGAKVVALRRVV